MIDTNGVAPVAAPDAQPEAPALPVFDVTRPRLLQPVTIMLDRERHLRLPFFALRAFEQASGVSPWDHEAVWSYPPSLKNLTLLLWAALLDEDPDLTIEQVERMPGLEFGNIHYLRGRLDECWGANQPDPEPAKERHGSVPNGKHPPG